MDITTHQCRDDLAPFVYKSLCVIFLSTFILLCFSINNRLRMNYLERKNGLEQTMIVSKLNTAIYSLKEVKEEMASKWRRIANILHTLDVQEVQIKRLLSFSKKAPATISDVELKKMRWVIQMMLFKMLYGMNFDLGRLCLDEFANTEGHSVRSYAEKYIYPEMITTPDEMYEFGLDYLYGSDRAFNQDTEIARRWFEKAAGKGHARAMNELRMLN